MNNDIPVLLQSSEDANRIANTVRGTILIISSVAVAVIYHVYGITISQENLTLFATDFGILAGAIWSIYGFILKLTLGTGRVIGRAYGRLSANWTDDV